MVQVLDRIHIHVGARETERQHRLAGLRGPVEYVEEFESARPWRARRVARPAEDLGPEDPGAAAQPGARRLGRLLDQRADALAVEDDPVVAADRLGVLAGEQPADGERIGHVGEACVSALEVEFVAEEQGEALVHERLDRGQARAEAGIDVGVVDVGDLDPESAAVPAGGADLLREMPHDEQDPADPELVAREFDLAEEQRLAADLDQDLRHVSAARVQSGAATAGSDHAKRGHGHPGGLACRRESGQRSGSATTGECMAPPAVASPGRVVRRCASPAATRASAITSAIA